jgi:hypothetical protein
MPFVFARKTILPVLLFYSFYITNFHHFSSQHFPFSSPFLHVYFKKKLLLHPQTIPPHSHPLAILNLKPFEFPFHCYFSRIALVVGLDELLLLLLLLLRVVGCFLGCGWQ